MLGDQLLFIGEQNTSAGEGPSQLGARGSGYDYSQQIEHDCCSSNRSWQFITFNFPKIFNDPCTTKTGFILYSEELKNRLTLYTPINFRKEI